MTSYRVGRVTARQFIAALLAITVVSATSIAQVANRNSPGAVYAMTNEATGNRIAVFARAADGTLAPAVYVPTGGLGSGTFENTAGGLTLTGQSPDNVGGGNQFLFATNPEITPSLRFASRRIRSWNLPMLTLPMGMGRSA
jgi:hypothetical protein